jgi:hypothetical protein
MVSPSSSSRYAIFFGDASLVQISIALADAPGSMMMPECGAHQRQRGGVEQAHFHVGVQPQHAGGRVVRLVVAQERGVVDVEAEPFHAALARNAIGQLEAQMVVFLGDQHQVRDPALLEQADQIVAVVLVRRRRLEHRILRLVQAGVLGHQQHHFGVRLNLLDGLVGGAHSGRVEHGFGDRQHIPGFSLAANPHRGTHRVHGNRIAHQRHHRVAARGSRGGLADRGNTEQQGGEGSAKHPRRKFHMAFVVVSGL